MKIDELEKFLSWYFKSNSRSQYIYTRALMRRLSINKEKAYLILNKLVKDGHLTKRFEFRCPNDDYTEVLKDNYINLSDYKVCPLCHSELVTRDNLYVVYEVNDEYK